MSFDGGNTGPPSKILSSVGLRAGLFWTKKEKSPFLQERKEKIVKKKTLKKPQKFYLNDGLSLEIQGFGAVCTKKTSLNSLISRL